MARPRLRPDSSFVQLSPHLVDSGGFRGRPAAVGETSLGRTAFHRIGSTSPLSLSSEGSSRAAMSSHLVPPRSADKGQPSKLPKLN